MKRYTFQANTINPDEYKSVGMLWIAVYMNVINVTYCDNFEIESSPKEIQKIIGNKNIETNIHIFTMCGYFSIRYIDFMFKGKHLTDSANLFSPSKFEDDDKVILKYILNQS